MTLQEAIITLKREYLGDSEYMELAKQMGAKALEKQIPKKMLDDGYFEICPTCGWKYEAYKMGDYCQKCGQRFE